MMPKRAFPPHEPEVPYAGYDGISSAQKCVRHELELLQKFDDSVITVALCEPFHIADLGQSIVLMAWILKDGEYVAIDPQTDLAPPFARISVPTPTEIIVQIIGESGSKVVAYYD